ncbi:DEAD/DEAH box helicase [Sediminicola luteus]|uniref:DEAD/DEAH box helicase n=1 Tax=Sediminicola luteus TaxID=319238 RepID=A0A2A4G7M1_9FLAO|nr:DEAD/DEAH box helicase [Sediminicola luteus]PCE63745.1 DEAD/DEAH box helicase [Sediminicola luteus]
MASFEDFGLVKQLGYALDDLGFSQPTPIQEQAFSPIRSGQDVVGIAQTGTGKTLAYMLPLLQDLKFSKQLNPRILILVPTRELVLQVVKQIESYTAYQNVRIQGVYGGTNINTQKASLAQGCDIVVGTPGRLYDLALSRALALKSIKKVVIDEVDVMLDLGFRFQLVNIFELLPERRQHIMFSATMTEDVDQLIQDYFIQPKQVAIALSGTPLDNIAQSCYKAPNFLSKASLLAHLLSDREAFSKVLVFVPNKRHADRLHGLLEESFGSTVDVIHSNKTQNYRINAIEGFEEGQTRILVSTDVMARGLDLDSISHVINFDVPKYPENYMHRIGRTGRAEHRGQSILFYTKKEEDGKNAIEDLMDMQIEELTWPEEAEITNELLPEERDTPREHHNPLKRDEQGGSAFHEKKEKNQKTNQGGKYRREIAKKYKKPKTRGDKNYNKRKRR